MVEPSHNTRFLLKPRSSLLMAKSVARKPTTSAQSWMSARARFALCDAPGKCPSNKWQLLAAPGRDGKDGATGPRGERGERGLIGPRGEPAPRITGWRVDHAAYTAVPLLSDGSEGAPLELRSLFKQFLDEVAPRA